MTCRPMQRRLRNANTIRRLRAAVMARDGTACAYCKTSTVEWQHAEGVPQPDNLATLDHVVRVEDGGTNDLDNLVIACRRCNVTRG